jgi:hypothetical protein
VNSIILATRHCAQLYFLLILYYFKHEYHTLLNYDAVWSVEEFACPEDVRHKILLNFNNKLGAKRSHIQEFCKPLQQSRKNFKLHIP